MKAAAIGIIAALVAVACSGSDPSGSPTPSSPASSSPIEIPTPSSGDFCAHRAVVDYAYRLVREGTVPYRQAAAAVAAASKVVRADIASVPTGLGARKLRQLALYLNTLRLAILGSVENYPEDYAVRQFTRGLVERVADVADTLDCPPA